MAEEKQVEVVPAVDTSIRLDVSMQDIVSIQVADMEVKLELERKALEAEIQHLSTEHEKLSDERDALLKTAALAWAVQKRVDIRLETLNSTLKDLFESTPRGKKEVFEEATLSTGSSVNSIVNGVAAENPGDYALRATYSISFNNHSFLFGEETLPLSDYPLIVETFVKQKELSTQIAAAKTRLAHVKLTVGNMARLERIARGKATKIMMAKHTATEDMLKTLQIDMDNTNFEQLLQIEGPAATK